MAKNEDIDLVLHLGDYIYEYDKDGYATEDSKRFNRVVDPKHEIVSLLFHVLGLSLIHI